MVKCSMGGQLRHGPDTTLVEQTIDFVRTQIASWRDDAERLERNAEDKLTLQLCDFLDSTARTGFPMVRFSREEPQAGQRKVDLAAKPISAVVILGRHYTIYDAVIVMECKRLPPPTRDREREYVSGGTKTTGGIQRFKLGLHGAKHATAMMIGYIQEEDERFWWRTINHWVDNLCAPENDDGCDWSASDYLQQQQIDADAGIATCKSIHGREGDVLSPTIVLEHLWVVMRHRGTGNQ